MNHKQFANIILEQSSDPYWMIDRNYKLVYANNAFQSFITKVEGEGKKLNQTVLFENISKDQERSWRTYYDRALHGERFEIDAQLNHKERNETHYYRLSFEPLTNEENKYYAVACHSKEISLAASGLIANPKDVIGKVEEEPRSKLLESVITNTHDAVLITEAEPFNLPGPKIIYVNEAFTKMTGYTAEEVVGKTPRIFQGPNTKKEELDKVRKALINWESCEITTINYKKNGEEFWINFTVTPVSNEKGSHTHWIAIQRDVTEQKTREIEKELLAQISSNFNIENDYTDAIAKLCKTISTFANFDIVEIWVRNLEKSHVQLISRYIDPNIEEFHTYSEAKTTFKKSEGLIGQVWSQEKAIFWKDISQSKDFVRKEAANKVGLRSVLGIPLRSNNEVLGVLMVGSKLEPDRLKRYKKIFNLLEVYIGSELQRKKLENDLNNLFATIPDILCLSDLSGRILKINSAACDLLGYTEDEFLQKSLTDFIHPDDFENAAKILSRLKEGETNVKFENRYLTKTGNIVWLSWYCSADLQERIVNATAKDITEEKKLKLLNKQASNLAKVGSWEYDLLENNLFWSDEVHRLHETDPNTFVPNVEGAIEFYKEEHKSFVADVIYKSINEGVYLDYEAAIISKSNKEKWIRVIANPEYIEGKCVKFIGSFQDITDLKEADVRLQSLSDNIPGVVFQYLLHPDGRDEFRFVSKGAKKIWSYSPEEVTKNLDLVWDQIKAGGDFEAMKKSIVEAVENKSQWSQRFRIVRPDGEKHIIQGSGTPNFLSNGTVLFSSLVLDVTAEAQNEELLKDLNQKLKKHALDLEHSNKRLREIAWTQSHIVRTPLSRILGIINLLENKKDINNDLSAWLDQLKNSTQELDGIVKKIIKEANSFIKEEPD